MEHCCRVLAGASSWYLDMLDKLQKHVFRIDGQTFAAFLNPLAYRRNV